MDVYGDYMRPPRRGRPRSSVYRCAPRASGQSRPSRGQGVPRTQRCWFDKICNFLIIACLISSVYWTFEYHCRSCNSKCDFRFLTRQINDITKNLTYMKDSYLELEQKMDILTHDLPKIEGQVEILETLAQTLGRPSNWEIRRSADSKRKPKLCKDHQPARGEILRQGCQQPMGDCNRQGRMSQMGLNIKQGREPQMGVNIRQGREPQMGVNLRQGRRPQMGSYPSSGCLTPKGSFVNLNSSANVEELYYGEEMQGSEVVVNTLIHEPYNQKLRSYSDRIIF